jgi:hypothetical protein
MPIDTRIDGDPASIRASADWLGKALATGIDRSVTDLFAARDGAEAGWQGDAGPAFRGRMDNAARKGDTLRADVERVARSFQAYADDLTTAQAGMERARGIAREAGLALAGTTILDPGPGLTPDQVTAYVSAQAEADRARGIVDAAKAIGQNVWDDVRGKALLNAGDFVNAGVVGGLAAKHTSILKAQAGALLDESKLAAERYLKAPGGSPDAKRLNLESYKKFMDADQVARRADQVGRRVGGKLPVIGLAITAAGIGYDIHQGKPAGKAIISGVGGALAAAGTGAAVGTMIGGPVGTVVGAGAGLVVGLVAGGALDWGYDQLPEGTKAAIEEGFSTVGDAIGDAGEGAKKVWNSIF